MIRIFFLCLSIFWTHSVWAEIKTPSIPKEAIDALLEQKDSLPIDDVFELKELKKKTGNKKSIEALLFVFDTNSHGKIEKEFVNLITKWIKSNEPNYRILGIRASSRILESTKNSVFPDLVKELIAASKTGNPPDVDEHVMNVLYKFKEQYPELLTPWAIEVAKRMKDLNPYLHKRAERILEDQDTEDAFLYFFKSYKENCDLFGLFRHRISTIQGGTLKLSDATKKKLIDFAIQCSKKGHYMSISSMTDLLEKDTKQLNQVLKDAITNKETWPFTNYRLIPYVVQSSELKTKYKDHLIASMKENQKFVKEFWRDSSNNKEWLESLFHKNERELVSFIHSNLSNDQLTLQQQFDILNKLTSSDIDIATVMQDLVKKMNLEKSAYNVWKKHFPETERVKILKKIFVDKEKELEPTEIFPLDWWPERRLLLSEDEKKTITPYLDQIKEQGIKSILNDKKSGQPWITVLSELGILDTKDKQQILDHILKIKDTTQKSHISAALRSTLKSPQEDFILNMLFKEDFPDRKSFINRSEQAERYRNNLSLNQQKSFDQYVQGLLKKSHTPSRLSACDILCQIRANDTWIKNEFLFYQPRVEVPNSEQAFAIKNLITLFDLKTRAFCPKNEIRDKELASFHQASLPRALTFSVKQDTQALMEHRREQEKKLDTISSIEDIVKGVAKHLGHSDSEVREILVKEQSRIMREQPSRPSIPTNSLLYGLIMGSLVLREVERLPKEEQAFWQDWKNKVSTGFTEAMTSFKEKESGVGGSIFSSYGIAMAAFSQISPPEEILKYMKETAKKFNYSCTIPYSFSDFKESESKENTADIYRSAVFYYVLWKDAKNEKNKQNEAQYRKALVDCIGKYVNDPWGRIHTKEDRERAHHIGERRFAPYYYYGTLLVVSESIQALKESGDLTAIESKMISAAQTEMREQIDADFDKEKRVFVDKASELYINRPIYYNPLMALALVPYCQVERQQRPVLMPARSKQEEDELMIPTK